jgi:5-methylcytosine-specific restriction endonuclease McrA
MSKGKLIKAALLEGKNYPTISKEIDVAYSTIAYHAKKLGLTKSMNQRRYDWDAIQKHYDDGFSILEVREYFGITHDAFREAETRGAFKRDIKRQHYRKIPNASKSNITLLNEMFNSTSAYCIPTIRKIIKRDNLIPYHCHDTRCVLHGIEQPEWNSESIVLHLDHINGVRSDQRLENLRWLCPNCHSLTSTYCGRNKTKDI